MSSKVQPSRPARPRTSARHRFAIASRALAAIFGGYGLATAATVALGRALALPGEEFLNTAALPAFLLYLGAAMWAFAASTATKAWLGIGIPAASLALVAWLLRATPAA